MNAQMSAEAPAAREPYNLRTLLLMLAAVTIPVVVLDQWSKHFVGEHMIPYENIVLIPNYLDLTYVLNPGAAFSLFVSIPAKFRITFLFILSTVAILVIVILLARSSRPTPTTFALALIMAGAGGNLIDRAIRGQVVDFVRAHYYSYSWPIFNVADSAISIGVALIFLGPLIWPGKHGWPPA